jgi:CxxC motif-containing protein (DUF1111 family)
MKNGIVATLVSAAVISGTAAYHWRSKILAHLTATYVDDHAERTLKVFENVPPTLGQPSEKLPAEKLAAFERGREQFMRRYDVDHGLGPHFNAVSCVACHDEPTPGGVGDLDHRVVTGLSPGERPDVENFQKFATPGFKPTERPAKVSYLLPPPLYGLGAIEAIPDEVLLTAGCSGNGTLHVIDGRVARFGIKTFATTLRGFVGAALFDEMGITNHVEDDRPMSDKDEDALPDPEISNDAVNDLTVFLQNLAPPPALPANPQGEALFKTFGCVACHRPETGPGVRAFTDLCMHSMGEALADGIISHVDERVPVNAPADDGDEFRTKPLWGLRFRTHLLHDGRATTPDEAIRLHGGEAAGASGRYQAATQEERDALLTYLNTL